MKIYSLLLACFALSMDCYADASLLDIPYVPNQECTGLDIDSHVIEKNQTAAKFLSKSTKSKTKTIETNLVTLETTNLGVHCHIGWYSDGNIGTALNGIEQGKQIVFLNNSVVGVSYDIEFINDYFVHKYTWGKVYSYSNRQVIKFN